MKYKNQLIIGSSILVILLAVFIGVRLTDSNNESNTIAKVDREIDNIADDGILDQDKVDEKATDTEEKDTLDQDKGTESEDQKTTEDSDATSKLEDEENADPTDKKTEEKTDEDATTDEKINEDKVDETDKVNEEDKSTSKKEEEEKTTDELDKNTEKNNEQSIKDDKVVYVFKNKYVVQSKETLSDIVKKCLIANKLEITNSIYFDHAKNLITKINNIADPNLIITGTKMIIPTKANFKGLLPDGEAYIVKTGDTIHEIVLNKMTWCEYYKAKEMLMKNNGIQNENEIRAGITIYIPTEDSEV